MGLITRIADKAGALGSVVSRDGMRCLFPGYRQFGAAIGLGFCRNTTKGCLSLLLPLFAVVALLANALGWLESSAMVPQPARDGRPSQSLAAMLLFWQLVDGEPPMSVGLALMIGVSIWDLPHRPTAAANPILQTRLTVLAAAGNEKGTMQCI